MLSYGKAWFCDVVSVVGLPVPLSTHRPLVVATSTNPAPGATPASAFRSAFCALSAYSVRFALSVRFVRSARFASRGAFPHPQYVLSPPLDTHTLIHHDTLRKLAKLACCVLAFASLMQGEERESGGQEQAP